MLYLTCTTITSVDLVHCGVSRAKDWVSVDCGTSIDNLIIIQIYLFLQKKNLYVITRERLTFSKISASF